MSRGTTGLPSSGSRPGVQRSLSVLYAAFLWWVGVRAVQSLLVLVGTGMHLGLLYNGASGTALLALLGVQEALRVTVLWLGIAAALRPGALEPSPLARHVGVLLGAILVLLGTHALSTLTSFSTTALTARELGVEGLVLISQGQPWIAVCSQLLHILTWMVVLVYLWSRVRRA
jgi:hypothetical protein